ncbi:uncharacterized protein LOC133335065 [Musca vetustissima]|uniref:uncharacterized protein LOC133335065 n=1 Tax=Musca vetustissima TaxID=27455 RepID=UPI002AB63078|nr:uncharacterized protein LOC133335065 [Musca vetustissima]
MANNSNIAINIDTEAETSIEQDPEERIATIASNATQNVTKSLFNLTLENFEDEEDQHSLEFKAYESRLHQEMKDWKTLLRQTYSDLKKAKQKHPIIDKSILSPEKVEYLEKAPCLQNFIRESMDFRQQAYVFLELDYANIMDYVTNLEEQCEHRLNQVMAERICENLANFPKCTTTRREF